MNFPRNIAEIVAQVPVMPLTPGAPGPVSANLEEAMLERLFGGVLIGNRTAAHCCRAGLLLRTGHIDAAHEIVQGIGTPDASYWHAIVHRLDGDHANSLYWYRRAGDHPVFAALRVRAAELAEHDPSIAALTAAPSWDPAGFLACCRSGTDGSRQLAQAEWEFLFHHCFEKAASEP